MNDILSSSEDFIRKLQRERIDYKYASQVRTIAKSLIQLSVGIYTEPERFVYELLQNAVDAFSDTCNDSLEILIKVEPDKFVFMHNGKAFSEKDVEGICDVGNGTKASDSKKIGYKGIGFKSVFMPSVNRVSIISGQFCFEFDKHKAHSLMPSFPPSEGKLSVDDIPWQVIPIDAPQLRSWNESGYNVNTIVYTSESEKIGDRVESLFSDLHFLLFLRSNNVNIFFERNGRNILSVGKTQTKGTVDDIPIVTLYKNNQVQSRWMLYSEDIAVQPEVKAAIENDFNTPKKLKGAESVEISFAVQINNDEVVPLKDTSLFTFLPTSYRGLRQPFLVNSNFITDAGRQQLHQESEWNKLIFKKIPELYLRFVSKFSKKYANYTEVLPSIYPDNDTLVSAYRSELQNAFDTIAFVPNRNGERLLKLSEVLVDKTGISKGVIPIEKILAYINQKKSTQFTAENFVDNSGIVEYAHNLINLFDDDELLQLLADRNATWGISVQDDIRLLRFLYEHFRLSENNSASYIDSLSNTSILLEKYGSLRRFNELFFPSNYQEQNKEASNVFILNEEIYDSVKNDASMVAWLTTLGMRDLSNVSFVEYLLSHPDYITTANALPIGRFLFTTWKQENFLEDASKAEKIKNLCFLAKDGQLRPICNLYLGSIYRPDDDMESICQQAELYISDDYPENQDVDDWAFFLKKCGAIYKVGIAAKDYASSDLGFGFLQSTADSFQNCPRPYNPYRGYWGYPNPIHNIHFKVIYFTFVDFENPNCELDKFIFSKVLSTERNKWLTVDKIYGKVSYWEKRVEYDLSQFAPYEYTSHYNSFLEYIIANEQKFPTTQGTSMLPAEVFTNTPSIVELGGHYLPILAIDTQVHDSWKNILPFKQHLTIEDLLTILHRISIDEEEELDLKKERISKIYREIIERDQQKSYVIAEWGRNHTILSQSGEFLPTNELTYITVDGFNNGGNKVYSEKVGRDNRDKLLTLLRTLGVKVITHKDITPSFTNPVENDELKTQLKSKLQYIALLQNESKLGFEERKAELERKIFDTHFYKCDSISLTYGEENDTISKVTFSQGDNFYYTGNISPALIEPLLSPLSNHLNLRNGNESKLMVILLTKDHQSLVDYLTDCRCDVGKLAPISIPNSDGIVCAELYIGINNEEAIAESNEAKRIVLRKLEQKGFDVSKKEDSYSVINGITRNNVTYPLVVKSCKNFEHRLFLNPSEWSQLFKPNSMLWLHFGGGVVAPIKAYELFTYQDKLTLSFDTMNLLSDDRVNKILEVMHYFNKVHLNLATINPDTHRGDRLEDYLFNENNPANSSLDTASID